MTDTKAQTVRAFLRGESAEASRFEVEEYGGVPCIIGYGWAIYAADLRDQPEGPDAVVLFGDGYKSDNSHVGWAGYSPTTTTHIHDIKSGIGKEGVPYVVADVRPQRTAIKHDTGTKTIQSGKASERLAALAESFGVEPQDTPRYYYQKEA